MEKELLFLSYYTTKKKQFQRKEIVRNLSDIQQEIIIKNGKIKYKYFYTVYFFDNPYKEKEKFQIILDRPLKV